MVLGVRTGIHIMPGFPTIVATSFIVIAGRWECIGPGILLLKVWGTGIHLLLILGRSHNPTSRTLVPLRILWSLLNYAELAIRCVVRVERNLLFLCILHPLHCILLGYGQVHYLMIVVSLDGVQFFIELRIKTPTEASHFLCIRVNILVTILTRIVEFLCILIHRVRTLPQGQRLIQLPFHHPLRNVMVLECNFEFCLSNLTPILLHHLEMIPPKQCQTMKIHCCKFNLSLLRAWQGENIQLKPATGEGMEKSTLVHTQIQIIIIHFLPSPFPPIPNG
jgi:hypothetical protein